MFLRILLILISLILVSGCGVQSIPQSFNQVEADWAEVLNQYQRRADLIPNLVSTVKGYASHEKETLESVISARAKANQIQLNLKDLNPETMAKYQQAQGELGGALSKLMMLQERYPDLKANENFKSLQVQLEGTENRIAISRRRYIEGVKNFNNLVSVFPTSITNSLFFKHDKKPQFSVAEETKTVPEVKF